MGWCLVRCLLLWKKEKKKNKNVKIESDQGRKGLTWLTSTTQNHCAQQAIKQRTEAFDSNLGQPDKTKQTEPAQAVNLDGVGGISRGQAGWLCKGGSTCSCGQCLQ